MASKKISDLPVITGASVDGAADLIQLVDVSDPDATANKSILPDELKIALGILSQEEVSSGTDNNQTGTAYTLVLTDKDNKTVFMNNAAANELTIPTNASEAFPIGTKIGGIQEGAGVSTITGDTGVTVNGVSGGSVVVNNQNQGFAMIKRATNTWIVVGDVT